MKTAQRLLLLWLAGWLAACAFAATQEQLLDPELREIYDKGSSAYYGQRDRDGALELFQELETRSAAKKNNYWHGTALWKQAQIFSDDGNQAESVAYFEKSLVAFARDSDFAGTANHLLLLGNLFGCYESRGQRGESLRIHRAMMPATGLNLARTSKLPADTPLLSLSDDQLRPIKNMAFIGIVYATEIRLRFESGEDADAFALAEKIDRRLTGTTLPREVTIYAGILESLFKLHLAAGRTAEAEQVLVRLIDLQKIPKSEAYDEILGARIDLALLRCRQGADPAPLFADAEKALDEARQRRWTQRWMTGRGKVARMHALTGNHPEGRRLIDAAITETRLLDEPRLLAELLLTRAELQLDAGVHEGVQADLFETLKWYRQQGGLRTETLAYVQYVRFLRLSGQPAAARQSLAETEARLRRFPDAAQSALLAAETLALSALPSTPPPAGANVLIKTSDLQPVELTTSVLEGWSARGRFTLTNPGDLPVNGLLKASGPNLKATWDSLKLQWLIHAGPPGADTLAEVSQRVLLAPLDQASLVLTVDPAHAGKGEIKLTWHGESDAQTVWWHFAQGPVHSEVAVIDVNLALENPFYSVPLHHYLVRTNADTGHSQNLRVVTTSPCRVEIVDAETGRVLAIDASGDGDFRGVGDVLFSDLTLDGLPDLRFVRGQKIAPLEIQVYPLATYTEVGVRLELQNPDGTWTLKSTDRLLGKQ